MITSGERPCSGTEFLLLHARGWLALLSLVVPLTTACGAEHPYIWARDVPQDSSARSAAIRSGDRLYILVRGQESATAELQVREDGSIVHALAGKVELAGLSTTEAAARMRDRLKTMLVEPDVIVSLAETAPPRVSVVGEVREPGRFDAVQSDSLLALIAQAGGLTEFANKDRIFVVRQHPAPLRVRFRYEDLTGGDTRSGQFRLRDGDIVVVE
jgi:polysaccharide biosynthesis/export protein